MNENMTEDETVISDAGSAIYVPSQNLKMKENQRFVLSGAQADMGFALPASIGVYLADPSKNVLVFTGDGSFNSNIQEMATIRQLNLPVKIFVWNNNGYLSIRNTQNKFYEGREYGTSSKNGLWFPDFKDIAESFEMGYYNASTIKDLEKLSEIFKTPGPYIIDCRCKYDQQILPSQAFKNGKQAPLHDMFPFLSDEELQNEMIDKSLL